MGRACSTNGTKRNAYRILVRSPEGKRTLRGPRRRWVDNIVTCFLGSRPIQRFVAW
jgi:hypothetical protein